MRTAKQVLQGFYTATMCANGAEDAQHELARLRQSSTPEERSLPMVIRRIAAYLHIIEKHESKTEAPDTENENQTEPAPKLTKAELKEHNAIHAFAATHAPKKNMKTFLNCFAAYFLLLAALICLASCTTTRPAPYTATIGQHTHQHDSRTRTEEPTPSHIK
jgi:hypothetical protein